MPALPYAFCQGTDARNLRLTQFGTYDAHTQTAQDIAINDMESCDGVDGYGTDKQLTLRFPSHVILSNIFGSGSRDLDTKLELEYDVYHEVDDQVRGVSTPCFVKWRIADNGAARRHKLAVARAPNANQVTEQLEHMFPKKKTGI